MNQVGTFDFVVVGGGTAGCVIAARLVEGTSARVCLIEAGLDRSDLPEISDFRNWVNLIGSEHDWGYEIEPQELGPAKMPASRARLLGGCSSHNATIALKAPAVDLARWEASGAAGWGPEATRAAFARAIERTNTHEAGPYSENACAFISAAGEAGYSRRECNGEDIVTGAGFLPMNREDHRRVSTDIAYLRRSLPRSGDLTVMTGALVDRVVIDEEGRATGVETDRGVVMGAEVILAAGVFGSAPILMRSGVGPAAHLAEVGVPVLLDLPAVGEHVIDHIETVVMWESLRPVVADTVQSCEAAAWVKTRPDLTHYDVFIHHVADGYWIDGAALGLAPFEPVEHAFTMAPYLARPASEGFVRLRSADPADPPVIDPRYFLDRERRDLEALVRSVRICREIAAQPALASWVAREVLPGPAIRSTEALADYVRRTANSEYHWVGGCRMGASDDPDVVVDPDLRVRGLRGLRVADGSIMPTHVGVNPALTTVMIGERCAELLGAVS